MTKIVFIAYDKYALLDTVPHLSKDFNVVLFSKPEDEFINGEIISKNCTKADAIERVIIIIMQVWKIRLHLEIV